MAVIDKTTTARVGEGATVDALGKAPGVTVADGSFDTRYTANGSDEGEISARPPATPTAATARPSAASASARAAPPPASRASR